MSTTKLGLSATPHAQSGSFRSKYNTQITQFGLMGITMKRYGSFTLKPSALSFRPAWALQRSQMLSLGVQ